MANMKKNSIEQLARRQVRQPLRALLRFSGTRGGRPITLGGGRAGLTNPGVVYAFTVG